MMTAKFLHCEIREKGGAYGGGAMVGGGLFSFYSYRWVGPPDAHSFAPFKTFKLAEFKKKELSP